MRIAIVSDVHGNFTAFRAVLDDLARQPVDRVLMGGDLALGGRQPGEVLELVTENGWPTVYGNTEVLLLNPEMDTDWRETIDWTLDRLGPRHVDYLRSLPLALRPTDELTLVHATPWDVHDVVLPDAAEDVAGRMVREGGAPVLAYGHIHSAYQRRLPEGLLLSVGAVAFSNDAEPRPTYTIVTLGDELGVEVRRVDYDMAAELAAMDAAGVPGMTPARRERALKGGPWPIRA